ncbi:MAG: ATP-binding protein [Okeania sp. SIO2H7]|nr:ATP-binding protein [Okeania sp. SIO2H7]
MPIQQRNFRQINSLLIGVEDNGNIFGLEKDLSLISKKNIDGFQQKLVRLILDNIGSNFINKYIKIRFDKLEGKEICIVDVKRSPKKAFLKAEKGLEFYIRVGNTSQKLTIPEIYDHF